MVPTAALLRRRSDTNSRDDGEARVELSPPAATAALPVGATEASMSKSTGPVTGQSAGTKLCPPPPLLLPPLPPPMVLTRMSASQLKQKSSRHCPHHHLSALLCRPQRLQIQLR